ncbi:unnamed protein product, partial [Rotaria sp. Silwood1]
MDQSFLQTWTRPGPGQSKIFRPGPEPGQNKIFGPGPGPERVRVG